MIGHEDDPALARLADGEVELIGQLAGSSNETFLVRMASGCADPGHATDGGGDEDVAAAALTGADGATYAVYKPELGERPLVDFPPGLFRRERAAYLLSRHLGWDLVPPTIIRQDGPFGIGSYQLFLPHDPAEHYFTLYFDSPGGILTTDEVLEVMDVGEAAGAAAATVTDDAGVLDRLRRMATFDILANNADRKGGHVLRGTDGRLWGIDHGLCFSADLTLRTVIWDFAGDRLEDTVIEDLWELIDEVPAEIAEQLEGDEARALQGRARWLAAVGELPDDPTGMRFPWPLV